jgi:hypothetical protein
VSVALYIVVRAQSICIVLCEHLLDGLELVFDFVLGFDALLETCLCVQRMPLMSSSLVTWCIELCARIWLVTCCANTCLCVDCRCFEMDLGPGLYDFLLKNKYNPFPIDLVREVGRQLLDSVACV